MRAECGRAAGDDTHGRQADPCASQADAAARRTPGADHQRTRTHAVAVTVWQRVDASLDVTFDTIVPVDLRTIFTGYGPLPAVVAVDAPPEVWGAAGQQRVVQLAGGGRVRERVAYVQRPGLFRYEVVPAVGPLRVIVQRIDGRLVFAPSETGGTVIRWTYVFWPRPGAHLAVRLLAPLWQRYAAQVLERAATLVQRGAAPQR